MRASRRVIRSTNGFRPHKIFACPVISGLRARECEDANKDLASLQILLERETEPTQRT